MPDFTIAAVAARTGCSPASIRFYEEEGLLGAVARGANGRRRFGWPEIARLRFIRRFRDLGFGLADIRMLIQASDGRECGAARALAAAQLETIRARRAGLDLAERALLAITQTCTADACADGPSDACALFGDAHAPRGP
ncbi:MAG: MerR family transcriptional regulator [Hydrogenophilaceae bacterium]|jgi:DNA-binding transcriptional MerR regulator|nr:MerR family transcriptional regulator [Hydrogenophilaceae bacterium]